MKAEEGVEWGGKDSAGRGYWVDGGGWGKKSRQNL